MGRKPIATYKEMCKVLKNSNMHIVYNKDGFFAVEDFPFNSKKDTPPLVQLTLNFEECEQC